MSPIKKKVGRVRRTLLQCLSESKVEILGQFLVLVTAALVGTGLTVINWKFLDYDGDIVDIGSWGSFFTAYATLFAIISGMVLANVLERFNMLNGVVEDELNAVESIRDCLVHLRLSHCESIAFMKVLRNYLISIAEKEWDLMAAQAGRDPPDIDSDTSDELAAIHNHMAIVLKQIEASSGEHRASSSGGQSTGTTSTTTLMIASNVMIPLVLELGKLRTNRLSLSEAQLPPLLNFLLVWMIFFLVIGFILMSVQQIYVNIFMTVAVSGAIQWLLTIITDLNHPFYGIWNVDRIQLDKLIAKFALQTHADELAS